MTTPTTKVKDYDHWWQGSSSKILAYIEEAWFERVKNATINRYEMPVQAFEDISDAGM